MLAVTPIVSPPPVRSGAESDIPEFSIFSELPADCILQPSPIPAAVDKPLFLIGMMGAGKTTIGRLLATALGYTFVDADAELESRVGVRVATIFELEGESGFRDREEQLLQELTARPGIVLATGGGAVLRPANRECLRERGIVIFLDAGVDEILRRTRHDTSRPLLGDSDGGRRERIESLLALRMPLYRQTAHWTFPSAPGNPRRLVDTILADLHKP